MKRGFTLVEILIVIVILGIMAAIVIPQFNRAKENHVELERMQTEEKKTEEIRIEQEKAKKVARLESNEIGDNLFWTEARDIELLETLKLLSLKGYKILDTELITRIVVKHRNSEGTVEYYNLIEPVGYFIYTERLPSAPSEKLEKE